MKRGDFFARSAIRNDAPAHQALASASLALALEPRFMYDAAGASTAAAVATAAESQPVPEHNAGEAAEQKNTSDAPSHQQEPTVADVGPFGSKAEAHLDAAAHADTAAPITEIIFVDASLPDIGSIAVRSGVEVVVLDPSKDGISQVNEALAGRADIAAIHFVGT